MLIICAVYYVHDETHDFDCPRVEHGMLASLDWYNCLIFDPSGIH
jgi:hypothetical protein